MLRLRRKSQTEEKTQKTRRKVGGKRVKTPIEKPPMRERERTKVAVPRQRSIVKAQRPETKRVAVTPMDVALQMKTKKGGKKK
ncbi:MAG: hypothetical protein EOM93_05570 [Gammaproteobacteria bacterium]|jgi:hypothetical protein|nr:hypothetical protein [Gammaproteobacteria bacterium]